MLQESLRKANSYEVTIADMAKRSERRAWRIAAGSLLMSLILAGGYFYLLPLKEKTPFLVMADAYTGTATVAQLRGDFSKNSITASDAINRSHVYHYVMARESGARNSIASRFRKRESSRAANLSVSAMLLSTMATQAFP